MLPTAPHTAHDTTTEAVLFLAFALSENPWKLGCSLGHGHTPRARTMAARDLKRLLDAVAQAKTRFGRGATAPVVSGDAAGRDGFWGPRCLPAPGIANAVGAASAIAGKRRQRRAKRERVDVRKWLRRLRRDQHGAQPVWRVVHVPAVAAEDPRHRPRALDTLKPARARATARLKG
jgi:hypothetical protein